MDRPSCRSMRRASDGDVDFRLGRRTRGLFSTSSLLGGVAIWATYLMGARVAGPMVGFAAAVLLATSPVFLYQLMAPMRDVPVTAVDPVFRPAGLQAATCYARRRPARGYRGADPSEPRADPGSRRCVSPRGRRERPSAPRVGPCSGSCSLSGAPPRVPPGGVPQYEPGRRAAGDGYGALEYLDPPGTCGRT